MTANRKAKVTPETLQEAKLLRAIWDSSEHPGQAIFGERYEIGNQSAVGQFLRGEVPLSLKAAAGFAEGLGCKIQDFSPRLARQAASYAAISGISVAPSEITDLNKAEMQLVLMFREIPHTLRGALVQNASNLYKSARNHSFA